VKKIFLILLSVIVVIATPSAVFANAVDRSFYSSNDIIYYDPNACPIGGVAGINSTTIEGNDNLEKILRYFTGKGLSLAAAAGIAGNPKQESGFNPAIIQGGAIAPDNYIPVNSVGFGLAQWTFTSRQQPLVDLSRSRNIKITDLGLQLDYIWQELTTGYKESTLTRLNEEKTDPARAAWIFHKYYEGSADSEAAVRSGRGVPAAAIYEKYRSTIQDGAGIADLGSAASTPENAYSDVSNNVACNPDSAGTVNGSGDTSGASSVTSDGFAVYNQFDPRWADTKIKRDTGEYTTYATSGCGPASMAMIINLLTGKAVDMQKLAQQSSDLGIITNGGGYNNLSQKLAPLYGLRSTSIPLDSVRISAALRNGSAIHIVGRGGSPFTTGGHFVMLRGITSSGKWLVGDSNGLKGVANSNNTNGFDPQAILGYATAAYELTK